MKKEQEYRKIMTRPHDMVNDEYWDLGERIMLPKKYKNLLFFDPLFIFTPQKGDTVYFNLTDPKQYFTRLIKYLENNFDWFLKTKKEFNENCQKIKNLMAEKSEDIEQMTYLIREIWPTITVAVVLGSTEIYEVSKRLRNICVKIRQESDDILHPAITHLSKIISKEIKKNYPEFSRYAPYILISEYAKGKIPSKAELTRRSKGYLFHKGKIVFNAEDYIKRNKIKLLETDAEKIAKDFIKGQIACRGKARGKVRIIFELNDLAKVEKGNILVTPMTTPDMMMAIRKAAAIITDEGGITCHAAIISRELKIPCIIGTKFATEVLKDGDLVEVDAIKGVVKIIK